jgi:N-(2-amino-2-carboxyethyl)-L-glutamate synthase
MESPKCEGTILCFREFGFPIYISLEGLNIAGSIKLNAAIAIMNGLERQYTPQVLKKKRIVESSSGNLAIALVQICILRGYRFTVIVDALATQNVLNLLDIYGAEIVQVEKRFSSQTFLERRIEKAQELEATGDYIWTNQYRNVNNPLGHFEYTAKRIFRDLPRPEYLFIGAGTCGTLQGISRFYRQHSPETTIIGVDVEGSIALGNVQRPRRIPGMGASIKPPHAENCVIDDRIIISEMETIQMVKILLAKTGILFGGSTGTVMAGIRKYTNRLCIKPKQVVTFSADFGEKYIDIYKELGWDNGQII